MLLFLFMTIFTAHGTVRTVSPADRSYELMKLDFSTEENERCCRFSAIENRFFRTVAEEKNLPAFLSGRSARRRKIKFVTS